MLLFCRGIDLKGDDRQGRAARSVVIDVAGLIWELFDERQKAAQTGQATLFEKGVLGGSEQPVRGKDAAIITKGFNA